MDGLALLRLLRERAADVAVVLMTAYDDMPTVAAAMREGAFDFLVKPLRMAELLQVLARAVAARRARELHEQEAATEAEAHRLDALVGREPCMVAVYKLVGQVAASRVNALIRGATGTGKGVVARAIHYNSGAAREPFIAVNCTALPQTLLESELFGHVRGSFTGAVSDRRGRFALAGAGTLFLDEVGDTTPEFQAKLLRVLEEHEYYPVGAEKPSRTEARVLAATHRDLERLVEQGQFREDLYYRLRIVELRLPPLRERTRDVPLLARHFVRRAAEEQHLSPPAIADDAMAALLEHDWPGNVRELENCMTRAVVLASGGVITPDLLALRPVIPAHDFATIDEMEVLHTHRALALADGNKTRAAELLGISKPRLYRILERAGVQVSG
jgi:DNA-binding NtrC family response regulator